MREASARALSALALAAALAAGGCKMTPEEIRVIEAENELLREQIQSMRDRCEQGRELELRPQRVGEHEQRPSERGTP
jgi:Tfp pilus assembly protein PilN